GDLASLLVRCARTPPDQEAWLELYRRFYHPVCCKVFRLMGSRPVQDREEVVQEVFLKLFRSLKQYQPGRAQFATYLSCITSSVVYDRWRHEASGNENVCSLDEELRAAGAPLLEAGPAPELLFEAAKRAVGRLDQPYKKAILSDLLEGMPVAQVSEKYHLKASFIYGLRQELLELVVHAVRELVPPPR
ncbi:MAG TPA: sigma-70 family RNA polymerase sigma factor, partial [Bryobacteraceae bacterium]|nr:sigma-70 family RNA polymerase sigma factor [Bryobacteraceae bacterium]